MCESFFRFFWFLIRIWSSRFVKISLEHAFSISIFSLNSCSLSSLIFISCQSNSDTNDFESNESVCSSNEPDDLVTCSRSSFITSPYFPTPCIFILFRPPTISSQELSPLSPELEIISTSSEFSRTLLERNGLNT